MPGSAVPATRVPRAAVRTPPRPVRFPLRLRVPGWCRSPELRVAGRPEGAPDGPGWATVTRTWRDGDAVVLRLPQRTEVRALPDQHGAVTVEHGPLTYSLKIAERDERYAGDDTFPAHEVHATTPWNYGLAPLPRPEFTRTRTPGPVPGNPFTHATTPVRITADARRIAEWTADDEHVVTPLQDSPARSDAPVERVALIPMGAARLRITAFPTASPDGRPWTPEPPYRRIENRHSGKVLAVDGMSTENSDAPLRGAGNRAISPCSPAPGDGPNPPARPVPCGRDPPPPPPTPPRRTRTPRPAIAPAPPAGS